MAPASTASRRSASSPCIVRIDDRQVGEVGVDPAGGLDPVEDRHRHVHHDDVGLELGGQADGLAAVAGLGDHRHAGVLERPADGLAQELMVVGEEDPHQAVPDASLSGCSIAHADLRSDAC